MLDKQTDKALTDEPFPSVPFKAKADNPWWRRILSYAVTIAAIIVLAIGSRNYWRFQRKQDVDIYKFTDCGITPNQARFRGCIYEPMQRAWIPPECYFSEPTEEYNVFRDREWYEDTNLTIPADIEGLESGDVNLAYTRYWHDEHCTYVLRKLALAMSLRKRMINSVPASIRHVNHCAHTIAQRLVNSYNKSFLATDYSMTESYLLYETCVPLQVRSESFGFCQRSMLTAFSPGHRTSRGKCSFGQWLLWKLRRVFSSTITGHWR